MTQIDLQQFLQNQQRLLNYMEKQLLQTRQTTAALHAESVLRSENRAPAFPIEFTSQFGEDLLAWTLFRRQTTGFFIEAGAFDGYRYSVTHALEAIGWKGLLVEAIPERAAQCAARRKNSRTANAVLSPDGAMGNAQFHVVQDQYGGMLSFSAMTPQRMAELGNAPRTQISVPRASLNVLLADHKGPIDLVSLDVEGDEINALQGFDLRRFRPRVLIIEDNSRGQDPALRNYMQPFEYISVGRLAVNDIFIRKDEAAILEEFKYHVAL